VHWEGAIEIILDAEYDEMKTYDSLVAPIRRAEGGDDLIQ